ncbi:MAG: SDR family NAD(P)-dependent oxidoreductase [Candidatus Thorarchaeota archaeon]|jgi:NAD(P)-dependent dehydrogenase (short-subunit alcohol dehydrogenase family)
MKRLEGKVILVTGAGRGFGKYMSLAYAKEGANVLIASRTINELKKLQESIEEKGGSCVIFQTDLLKLDDMIRLRDYVEKQYGRLDTLVNCAADNLWKVFEETTIEEWDKSISINLRAPFILSKLFLPMMKIQGRGSIINISSGSATKGFIAEIAYCPSKYGLEGLTQCLAMEFYQYNIAVNSVSPSAPEGKKLKPSKLTLREESKLADEIRAKYADDDSIVEAFSEAWSFLALQDAHGVTAQRFVTKQLADYLKVNGWEETEANWKSKLTKAVYESYDLPEMVYYDTMLKDTIGDAGQKIRYFPK